MTLNECCVSARKRLESHYPVGEAREMVRIIMANLKGYSPVDLIVKSNDELSDFITGKVDAIVNRLLSDEPIQYIFGNTQFYGLTIKVDKSTLIPRPETEELVDLIVKENGLRPDMDILDMGTGSGCIALALARNIPFSHVTAIDLSAEALDVARENARALKAQIEFQQADALKMPPLTTPTYDIIVSNPPYICQNEKEAMEANVLNFEPHMALFVPDDDPLRFYHAISSYALLTLRFGGKLYFELNPLYATRLKTDMEKKGWDYVDVIRDSYGKYRFLKATKRI